MEVIYALDFSQTALKDIEYFKRLGDKSIIRKIDSLLKDLEQHPLTGVGKSVYDALPLRYLCATLIILTLGVGQMWG